MALPPCSGPRFQSRGGSSFLIYSSLDGGLDSLDQHLGKGARKPGSSPRFRVLVLDGPDHTFTPVWTQTVLVDHLLEHLLREAGG